MERALTTEQRVFADEVRRFTSALTPEPTHASLEAKFRYLSSFQRSLHEAGLAVPTWPKRFGGRGLDAVAAAIVSDELGRASAPEVINFVATDIVAPALMRFAADDRLERWLPAMASADQVWCQLFSEPDAGSDLASMRTRSVPVSDGWLVSGEKVWSTWAQFATYGLLLARTGPPDSRHRGITAFVIDMASPGVDVRPLTTMTGEDEFAAVHLDEVRVGPDDVVGEVGGGWAVALYMLAHERGPYAVRRASVLRGALGRLLEQARSGMLDPALRDAVVGAHIDMELLDLQINRVVDQIERGDVGGSDAPITKRLLTIADQSIFAVQHRIGGATGMAWEHGNATERIVADFLYSRAASIYGGAQEIQRNMIAERLLGLPRDQN